jgi:hypothetical protein
LFVCRFVYRITHTISVFFQVVTDHNGHEKTKKTLGGAYPGQRPPQHQPYAPASSDYNSNGTAVAHFMAYGGGNALTLVRQDGSNKPEMGQAQPMLVQGKERERERESAHVNACYVSLPIPITHTDTLCYTVTLPAGVQAGQTIHVQAPDGKVNAIIVPQGLGPGSVFTVEFASEEEKFGKNNYNNNAASSYNPSYDPDYKQQYNSQPQYSPPPQYGNQAQYGSQGQYGSSSQYSSPPQYSSSNSNQYAPPPPSSSQPSGDDGFASGFNNPNWRPHNQQPVMAQASIYNNDTDINGTPYTTATPVYTKY